MLNYSREILHSPFFTLYYLLLLSVCIIRPEVDSHNIIQSFYCSAAGITTFQYFLISRKSTESIIEKLSFLLSRLYLNPNPRFSVNCWWVPVHMIFADRSPLRHNHENMTVMPVYRFCFSRCTAFYSACTLVILDTSATFPVGTKINIYS